MVPNVLLKLPSLLHLKIMSLPLYFITPSVWEILIGLLHFPLVIYFAFLSIVYFLCSI